MDQDNDSYIPALRYRWLTRFYDPIVAITSREKVFKKKLLAQGTNTHANSLPDLACDTGTLAQMIKLENPEMKIHGPLCHGHRSDSCLANPNRKLNFPRKQWYC